MTFIKNNNKNQIHLSEVELEIFNMPVIYLDNVLVYLIY